MAEQDAARVKAIGKWKGRRGALIMALHELQNQKGYVPRDAAMDISNVLDIPLAQIYEVLTFYNYFKLEAPGRAVVSVCTGTACHLKGAPEIVKEFSKELGLEVGESSKDGAFHLQCVRCVGCCGLAPVVVVNDKTYGRMKPSDVKRIISEWRERFAKEDASCK